jgi:hypothetical protein
LRGRGYKGEGRSGNQNLFHENTPLLEAGASGPLEEKTNGQGELIPPPVDFSGTPRAIAAQHAAAV